MPAIFSKQRFCVDAFQDNCLPRSAYIPTHLETLKPQTGTQNQSKSLSPAMEQPDSCPVTRVPKMSEEQACRSYSALKVLVLSLEETVESRYCDDSSLASDLKQATAALKSYLLYFHFHGFDFTVASAESSIRLLIRVIEDIAKVIKNGNTWVDYFKYKNAAFFGAWNDQKVLPTEPSWLSLCHLRNPKYLIGGHFYQWLHRRMREDRFRKEFSLDILQSKKGMPRPPSAMVKKAEQKSVEVMTTPKPQSVFVYEQPVHTIEDEEYFLHREEFLGRFFAWKRTKYSAHTHPSFTFTREFMESQVIRTTKELFKDFNLDLATLSNFLLPSSSANYNMSRSWAGTWGVLNDLGRSEETGRLLNDLKAHLPVFRAKMTKLRNKVSETYGAEGNFEEFADRLLDLTQDVIGVEIDYSEFLKAWRAFYWRCVKFAWEFEQDAFCQVVGLSEPLKVRTISKGPPVTYFVLKPLQHAMWMQLQKHWNFELTGTPITEKLMNRRYRRYIGGGYRFHSGDYSAATDELHSWVSEAIANTIVDCWDKNAGFDHTIFRWLFLNSLTGHTYVAGLKSPVTPTIQSLAQRRGQLMGSITSFPVLCVANASLMRVSYEIAHCIKTPIYKLPVWINGDDCLTAYYAPEFPALWSGLGDIMGFKESIGKTYDSDCFCSINSNTFDIEDDRWVLRKYINLGLVFGLVRSAVGGNSVCKRAHQLGSVHRKLMEMTPDDKKFPVHDLFMETHRKTLESYPGPWFLPEYLCGLGLVDVKGVGYSEHDLKLVTALRHLYNIGVRAPPLPTQSSWRLYDRFHELCRRACPLIGSYSYENYDGDDTYGDCFKALMLSELVLNGFERNLVDKRFKHHSTIPIDDPGYFLPDGTDGLFIKEEKRCYQERLITYRMAEALLHEPRGWTSKGEWTPADPQSVDYEKKERIIPIFGRAC